MSKKRRFRSLDSRFSFFTAALVVWVTLVERWFQLQHSRDVSTQQLLLGGVMTAAAVLVARITIHVFVRPLGLLERGMARVKEGKLERVPVSQTGDEVERLGERFNEMIEALDASRRQVQEHHENLEERIRERTEALELSMNRAEAATKAKSEFLANMSHELRTPLNGIQGMLEIVLESEMTVAQREELETARECSNALLTIVNDILDLSKIEAGRMNLEAIPFSPRTLAECCLKIVAPKAQRKNLRLDWDVSPNVPPHLVGDPHRLRQVILNLLGNAIKYTHEGFVRLQMASVVGSQPGREELQIQVLDSGIGIPKDMLESIFEEFTQADGSITRLYGGTGLGLAIAKRLVEMHGGRIWAESELGGGSTFYVSVEFEVAEVLQDSGGAPPDDCLVSRPVAKNGDAPGRILVVEDNAINQQVVEGLLSKRGYQVRVVNHGGEALAVMEGARFDLILMDVQMPVLDGLETTRRIRQDPRWRDLPIVGLTAHTLASDRNRCIAAGMSDYLPKPVRPAALLETVKRFLAASTSVAS